MVRASKRTPEEKAEARREKSRRYNASERGKAVRAQGSAARKRGRRKVAKGHITRVPPLPSGVQQWSGVSVYPDDPTHASVYAGADDFDGHLIHCFLDAPPFNIPESEREAARVPHRYRRGGTLWQRERALDGYLERGHVEKQRFWAERAADLKVRLLHEEIRAEIRAQLEEWDRILDLNKSFVTDSVECVMWERHLVWKARMPCLPPYHPCPGHENTREHDRCSQCLYYTVWTGFVRGAFSNSWIAREQTERFTDSRQKSFKTKAEMDAWWASMCADHHSGGCPPFEPVSFSLVRNPITYPSSAPCTRAALIAAAPLIPPINIIGPSTSVAGSSSAPPPAPSPFNSPRSRDSSASSPAPQKEEATTPQLSTRAHPPSRLLLTPTGMAGMSTPGLSAALGTPTPASSSARARGPSASVLVTPNPHATPRPAPDPAAPLPPVRMYGIRNVSIFFPTFEAARQAAENLKLSDSKIMVSSNYRKLEAWMSGEPFDAD
ncbi:hypothetical protein GGX14DRAFT_565565 [Mycena pura]|uniref:Ribonuclease H1 N-terminal domain-containing protein n=1 Tax=Mycena pura TaxID=153505 RepID=A0AAD6VHU1_9AGAR|nr:hypothetical protein GGX14DRAFT_565565 [Mycena pura]